MAAYLVIAFVAIMGITAVASGFIGLPGLDRDGGVADANERPWVLNRSEGGVDPDLMSNLSDDVLELQQEIHTFNDSDRVQFMVSVHDECLVDIYLATDGSLTFQQFLGTRTARTARENMQRRQREIFNRAAVSVDSEMTFSFTSLINAFAMTIYYRDRHIADNAVMRAGATGTMVHSYVELLEAQRTNAARPPVVDNVDALDGLLDPTGIFRIPEIDGEVMQGEGMIVSVIDSGLDYDHHMFSTSNLPHIWCNTANDYIIDVDRLAMTINPNTGRLNIRGADIDFNNLFASAVQLSNLTPLHTYRNHKVPFVFDYVDMSHHVNTAIDNAHGTHVSGIIVGNTPNSYRVDENGVSYDPNFESNTTYNTDNPALNRELRFRYVLDEERPGRIMLDQFGRNILAVRGVTPKAQIVNMKVFSDFGRTPDVSILAAVHDSAILGVDAINLSLGAVFGSTDFDDDDFAQHVYRQADRLGISLIVANGNSATAMTGGHFGTNLASSPDSGASGTPASLIESFAVASMEGIKAPYMMLSSPAQEVGVAYFTEVGRPNGDQLDFTADLRARWESTLFNLDEAGFRIPNPNAGTPGVFFGGTNPNGLDINGMAWGADDQGVPQTDGWGALTVSDANSWWRAYAPNTALGAVLRTNIARYLDLDTGELRIPFIRAGLGFGADFMGRNFAGSIALIERGMNTFTEKLENAQAAGAMGAIIHNHLAGTIRMSVEEHVTIPASSISLDAHAPLRAYNEGYIIVHPDFQGGPFMSGFTSWGVTPDLRLSPDITGHGGQILSAHPGQRYDRNSGTSMAAPNVAGLALVYRQFLTNPGDLPYPNNYPNARRFGLMNESNTRPCPNLVQVHIYRMMQSTAIMPLNEHGDPYSPRRVGAGLANIRNMLRSDAWIEVPEFEEIEWRRDSQGNRLSWSHNDAATASYRPRMTENGNQVFGARAAINLFDDPQRTGVYNLEFDIVNRGDTPLTFRPTAQVFTETLALHPQFDIIAERATMLYNTMANGVVFRLGGQNGAILANGGNIEVAAGDRITIAVRIELDDNIVNPETGMTEREWINDTFPNGIYIEGFIRLYAVDDNGDLYEDGVDLSVPYLAFFGDWTDAPIFEHSIYEIDRYERMEIPPHDRLRNQMTMPTQAFGRYVEDDNIFSIPLGSFLFNNPRQFDSEIPLATESRTSLSLGHNGMHQIAFVGGFIRNARRVDFRVLNQDTGVQVYSGTVINARRRLGPIIDLDMQQMGARNGGAYRFELRAFLQYAGEYNHVDGPEGWEFTNANNEFGFDFTINSTAPTLVDATVRYARTATHTFNRFLDLYIQSDHYLMGKTMQIFNKGANRFDSIWNEVGMRPLTTGRNAVTRITYSLSEAMWEELSQNDFRMSTRIYDFSFNSSFYELDLFSLMTAAGDIGLADIGQYTTLNHRDSNETLRLFTSHSTVRPREEIYVLDNNGDHIFDQTGAYMTQSQYRLFSDEGITVRRHQNIPLRYALVANENFWREDVFWESSNRNIVDVNWDGQIFSRAPGVATITVGSVALREQALLNPALNINYRFDLPVRVLSAQEEYNFGLISSPSGNFGLSLASTNNLEFTEQRFNNNRITTLNAGQEVEVEISALPWFTSLPNMFDADGELREYNGVPIITWESSVPGVVEVFMNEDNPLSATVIGARGTFTPFGRYGIAETEHYTRGTIRELMALGFSNDDIDPGTYIPNQINRTATSIQVTIRFPGTVLMGFMQVIVRPEFVVENGVLIEYNGCNVHRFTDEHRNADGVIYDIHEFGTLIIPSNIGIRHIGFGTFNSHPYITRVIFPERFAGTSARNYVDADYIGIITIRGAAFAYMPNLREVILPSTLQEIGNFAFAAENTRLYGTTTSLVNIDFSRIRAPISVGQASFQNQVLLGVRGSHWIYSFENNPLGERVEFRPGIIVRDSIFYVDDGRVTPRRAVDATWTQAGAINHGDWRWHSVDGPAHDEHGNITDPSDTFYFRWEGNPVNGGQLVPGAFDMNKIITFANHAFASADNLKFVDLTNARAMNHFVFVNMGRSAGRGMGTFTLREGRHAGSVAAWQPLLNEVSVVIGPNTYLGRGIFAQSGINTPVVIPTPRIPELAFAAVFRIPSFEFTARDIVIQTDAFDRTWAAESIRFTGRYQDANGNILSDGDAGYGVQSNWMPASVEAIQREAFITHFGSWWGGPQNTLQIYVNSVEELYFAEDVMVRRIESNAFVGFWLLEEFYLPNGLEYLGANAFVDFDVTAIKLREDFGLDRNGNPIENLNIHSAFETRNRPGRITSIDVHNQNVSFIEENGVLLRRIVLDAEYEFVMVAPNRPFTNFVFPNNVVSISPFAFANANITQITIPATVDLSRGMFASNQTITSITIEGNRSYIPANMFDGASNLANITFEHPGAVLHIHSAAFRGTAIQNISFPNLVRMDSSAFMNSALREFTFGAAFGSNDNPNSIALSAFEGTANLSAVHGLNANITHIGNRAFANSGIAGTFENSHILSVGNNAFLNARSLTSVVLPNAIDIGNNAFRLNARATTTTSGGLTSLEIPNIEIIGNGAFFNQDRAMNVGSLNYLEMLGAESFMNTRAAHQGTGTLSMPAIRAMGNRALMNNEALSGIFGIGSNLGVAPIIDENDIPDNWHMGYSPTTRHARDVVFINGILYLRTGIYSDPTFTGLGTAVFANTNITGFMMTGPNDIYHVRESVLFRHLPNHSLNNAIELVAYPTANTRTSWAIPENVVRIDDQAFINNQALRLIVLPSTLLAIGDRAFFGTQIHTYRFMSFNAPRLESSFIQYDSINLVINIGSDDTPPPATRQTDINPHIWAVYANFFGYFTPGESSLIRSTTAPNVGDVIRLDYTRFIYNPISPRTSRDFFVGAVSDPRVSRLTGTCFGLTIERPRNAQGFSSFIYTHYFANETLLAYVRETSTLNLINQVNALDLDNLVLDNEGHNDEVLVESLRGTLHSIRTQPARMHQLAFVPTAVQNRLDQAVAIVGPMFVANIVVGNQAPQDLNALVNALPSAADFNPSNASHLAAINAVVPVLNQLMSTRPHYAEFVTGFDNAMQIEVNRHATNFLAMFAALPSLDEMTIADRTRFADARTAFNNLVAGRAHLAGYLFEYFRHVDNAVAIIDGAPTVRFMIESGVQAFAPMRIFAGNVITNIAPVTKEGYNFVRWTFMGQDFDFNTPIVQDMTFFAEWTPVAVEVEEFVVTFNSAGGSSVTNQTIESGQTATRPTNPTRDGYTFDGWFVGNTEFNFSTAITGNITLTARWTAVDTGPTCPACGTIGFSDIWPAGLIILVVLAGVLTVVMMRKKKKE